MPIPHIVLRILMEAPAHGYELRQAAALIQHFYPSSNVNVYPVLKSLEQDGYVASREEIVDARHRKVYEITPTGVAEFERWFQSDPESPLPTHTDLVALKLILAPRRADIDLDWPQRVLADVEKEIAGWRTFVESNRSRMTRLANLTVEYRLRSYELRRDYLQAASAILGNRE
jgi:DNA-binding PadR family transcriptional regulator